MRQRIAQSVSELLEPNVEELARTRPPDTNIDREHQEQIAALAWELHKRDLPTVQQALYPRWHDMSEGQRASCRVSVLRTIQALIMLGWIDLPS